MNVWLIVVLVVAMGLVAGLLSPRRPRPPRPNSDEPAAGEWDGTPADAETLARLGTPETVADLVAEGRAGGLRGLGYRGELPPEG